MTDSDRLSTALRAIRHHGAVIDRKRAALNIQRF